MCLTRSYHLKSTSRSVCDVHFVGRYFGVRGHVRAFRIRDQIPAVSKKAATCRRTPKIAPGSKRPRRFCSTFYRYKTAGWATWNSRPT